MKGEIALKQRRYAEAAAALQQALELDPGANKLYSELAQALQGQGDSNTPDSKTGDNSCDFDSEIAQCKKHQHREENQSCHELYKAD